MKKLFLIVGLLMLFIPIIMDIDFMINIVETEAIITEISPYTNSEGDTYYHVGIMFEANGQTYSGTLLYNNIENINVNDTQRVVYNAHNPNRFSNNNNRQGYIKDIIALFGFIMTSLSILLIINSNKKGKRKNKTFGELNNTKVVIRIFVISTIFLILSVIVIYKKIYYASTIYFLSMLVCIFSGLGVIFSFVMVYSFLKMKHDEIYPILINDKYDKKVINNEIEVFFTPTCIVDTSRIFKKINYKDIALIDFINMNNSKNKDEESSRILIVDKKLKLHRIAISLFHSEKELSEIFKELEKRVPNALVGYNKENLKIIKYNRNN